MSTERLIQLNRVELRGNVGSVHRTKTGDIETIRFSLVTNYVYKAKDGNPVIETTWHNIVVWQGRNMPDLGRLDKGIGVYLTGRIRSSKYTAADGSEKTGFEIIAAEIEILDGRESLNAQCNI